MACELRHERNRPSSSFTLHPSPFTLSTKAFAESDRRLTPDALGRKHYRYLYYYYKVS